jgi:L-fuconolactonase
MYGSDWPVVRLAANYPTWVETALWAIGHLSDEDRRKLFWSNAARFYRLESEQRDHKKSRHA